MIRHRVSQRATNRISKRQLCVASVQVALPRTETIVSETRAVAS